jgi:hypothetical protein
MRSERNRGWCAIRAWSNEGLMKTSHSEGVYVLGPLPDWRLAPDIPTLSTSRRPPVMPLRIATCEPLQGLQCRAA